MFIVNVEGAIIKDDKWLIIKRSEKEEHAGGELSLVGGKTDREGDTANILERTLKREIMEEVGIEVKDAMHYVCSSSFVTDSGKHVVDVVFLCEYAGGEAAAQSADEVAAVFWMTTEDILSHPTAAGFFKKYIGLAETKAKALYLKNSALGD